MRSSICRLAAPALLAAVAVGGCRTLPREAEPGSTTRPTGPRDVGSTGARGSYTAADVAFMQHMIPHHAQALAMTRLVPGRSTRADMRLLAERIEVSQRDEIAAMQQWLRDRGEQVPTVDPEHAHHAMGGHENMPGMLSAAEMAQLERATGPEFDRLFLQLMIRHHEGALTMVRQLLASPGAAQQTQVFSLASEVEADQRAEIARMRALLGR